MATLYGKYNKREDRRFRFFLRTRHLRIKLLAPYYRRKFSKFVNEKYYIALDFDGTLVEDKFPDIGPRNDKCFRKLLYYYDMLDYIGVEMVIILWTCRHGKYLDEAKNWTYNFLSHRIRPRYFNENPERGHGSPKVFAHEYWDDCGRRMK